MVIICALTSTWIAAEVVAISAAVVATALVPLGATVARSALRARRSR